MENASSDNTTAAKENYYEYCRKGGLVILPKLAFTIAALYILGIIMNCLHVMILARKEPTKNASTLFIQISVVLVMYALSLTPGVIMIDIKSYQNVPEILLRSITAVRSAMYGIIIGIFLLSAMEHYLAVCRPHVYKNSRWAKHLSKFGILVWVGSFGIMLSETFASQYRICILEGMGPHSIRSMETTVGPSAILFLLLVAADILLLKAILKLQQNSDTNEILMLLEKYKPVILYLMSTVLLYSCCFAIPLVSYILYVVLDIPAAYFSYTQTSAFALFIFCNPVLSLATNKKHRDQLHNVITLMRRGNRVSS